MVNIAYCWEFRVILETDYYELPDFRNQWQQKIDEQLRAEEEEQRSKFNQKKKLMESMGEGIFEVFLVKFGR